MLEQIGLDKKTSPDRQSHPISTVYKMSSTLWTKLTQRRRGNDGWPELPRPCPPGILWQSTPLCLQSCSLRHSFTYFIIIIIYLECAQTLRGWTEIWSQNFWLWQGQRAFSLLQALSFWNSLLQIAHCRKDWQLIPKPVRQTSDQWITVHDAFPLKDPTSNCSAEIRGCSLDPFSLQTLILLHIQTRMSWN